jgi:hypothetical protein
MEITITANVYLIVPSTPSKKMAFNRWRDHTRAHWGMSNPATLSGPNNLLTFGAKLALACWSTRSHDVTWAI